MKKPYLISFFLLFAVFASAQVDFQQFVPQNPNVSALFKSTITPVSEYSGTANIGIPFYTLSEGSISVPIGISYATGGIQVSEEASTIGLGWALNAGGAITRVVKGADDFSTEGMLTNNKKHPDLPVQRTDGVGLAQFWDTQPFVTSLEPSGSTTDTNCTFTTDGTPTYYQLPPRAAETIDTDFQHDVFMFNFMGRSGSFVFTKDSNEAYLLNKSPLKIWYEGNGNGINTSLNLFVLDEMGTRYEFTQRAFTQMPNLAVNIDYVSAWHLKRVVDIYGNEAIFNYHSDHFYHPLRSFNQIYNANISTNEATGISSYFDEFVGPKTKVQDVLISSIELRKNGSTVQRADFDYSIPPPVNGTGGERKDLDSRFLKSVKVYNGTDVSPVETYDLYQSYFGVESGYAVENIDLANGDWGSTIGIASNGNEYPHVNLRLRLDSIAHNQIEKHSFEYIGCIDVPNKTSMSQDYWGFYNGVFNDGVFIPEISNDQEDNSYVNQGRLANRFPYEEAAKIFSLKSITYPTKGTTEYGYELHTFDQSHNPTTVTTRNVPYSAGSVGLSQGVDRDIEIITPNQDRTLRVNFSVVITGWNKATHPTRPDPPNFAEDMYVVLKKMDGTIIRYFTLDTNVNDWYSFEPGDYNDQGPGNVILKSVDIADYSYDSLTPAFLKLDEEQYILESYFDSHDGLYYGQTKISTSIEEETVSEVENYSQGGGLRIASITNKDHSGEVISQKVYEYEYTEPDENNVEITKSHGKLKTVPDFSIEKPVVFQHGLNDETNKINYGTYVPRIAGAAGSQTPWSRDQGSFVGYTKVVSTDIGVDGPKGKVVKTFVNQVDKYQSSGLLPFENDPDPARDSYHSFPPIRVPHNGLPVLEEIYNADDILLSSKENLYMVNGTDARFYDLGRQYFHDDFVMSAVKELPYDESIAGPINYYCDFMSFQLYPHYSNLIQQTGVIQTVWDKDGQNPVTTTQEFEYANDLHFQRTESKLTNSKGEEVLTRTYYADDITDTSSLGAPNLTADEKGLIDRFKKDYTGDNPLHRVAEPIQTVTTVNGAKTVQRTYYKDWDGDENVDSYRVWPEKVQTLKGAYHAVDNPMENRLNYHQYDDRGNPLEVSKENGTKIAYIWAYDGKYPVAKIEHSGYTNAANAVQAALPAGHADLDSFLNSLAGIENDPTKKTTWDNFNMNLRNALDDQMVTTYTYTPLVGVTSVTDPRGYTMYYQYDAYNRLQEVRDADDHLVTDYEYHYKGQTNN